MKRALAIAVAVCTLGVAGFGITLKGSWTATVCLLPATSITSSLTLTYTVAGYDVTSVTGFGVAGITSQRFALRGAFGPFSVTGNMWFGVTPPAYLASDLTTSFDFGGVAIGLMVRHWTHGNFRTIEWHPDTDPCAAQTPPEEGYLQYIFTGTVAPVRVRARFVDCCTGTEFQDLLVTLSKIGLCCGISYDASLLFTKAGFSYLDLSGVNVPLCCGISFDVGVRYGVDYKTLTITPKFAGIGDACFTVWGGPAGDWVLPGITWGGIEIYGFRIRCTIGDCNFIEFVNAIDRARVNPLLPAADRFSAICDEFELVKLGFCGPGCCGGRWDVTLRVFFGTGGGLFDLTRMTWVVNIPIMTGFTLNLTGTMPAAPGCGTASFCFGWTFTF